jgi:hypothetical protein
MATRFVFGLVHLDNLRLLRSCFNAVLAIGCFWPIFAWPLVSSAAARMSKGQECPTGDSSLGRSESLVVVRGCLMGGVFLGEIRARRVAGDWRVVGRFFLWSLFCGKRCLRGRSVLWETLSWGDLTCEGAFFGETWLGLCDGETP